MGAPPAWRGRSGDAGAQGAREGEYRQAALSRRPAEGLIGYSGLLDGDIVEGLHKIEIIAPRVSNCLQLDPGQISVVEAPGGARRSTEDRGLRMTTHDNQFSGRLLVIELMLKALLKDHPKREEILAHVQAEVDMWRNNNTNRSGAPPQNTIDEIYGSANSTLRMMRET